MKKNKFAKISENPSVSKIPKISEEPADYKQLKAAWQIGLIDYESKWGYTTFSEKIKFKFSETFFTDFENLSNGLYEVLNEIDRKEFNCLNSLMHYVSKKAENITKEEYKAIIQSIKRNFFEERIFPKLKEFERKNWHEIEDEKYGTKSGLKSKHHTISLDKLAKDAQKRLEQLKLNDIPGLFSLRLEGKLRIFGIRKFNYLQIIWIDPDHEICPTQRN